MRASLLIPIAVAMMLPANVARAMEATAEQCIDIYGEAVQAISLLEWDRLKTDCFEKGFKSNLGPYDFDDIPMDVPRVDLLLDIRDGHGPPGFGLGSFPTVIVHPVVRDLYCREFADDWAALKVSCPLPPMYSVAGTSALGLAFVGPQVLLQHGVPYDLVLSGNAFRLDGAGGDTFTYYRSVTLDDYTGDHVSISNAVIRGDLVVKDASIRALFIEKTIVTGRIVFDHVSIGEWLSIDNVLVHGGVSVESLTGDYRTNCTNKPELASVPASSKGPMFVPECLVEAGP